MFRLVQKVHFIKDSILSLSLRFDVVLSRPLRKTKPFLALLLMLYILLVDILKILLTFVVFD